MKVGLNKWLLLRLVLLAANIAMVIQISTAPELDFDWLACVLVSAFYGVSIFAALFIYRSKQRADLSDPYTLTGPFFPFGQYPLRSWFTFSWMILTAGMIASVIELISHRRLLPINVMFFLWGLLTLCAVVAHVRLSTTK